MQLRAFIILLHVSTMGVLGVRDMIKYHVEEGQATKCGANVSVGGEKRAQMDKFLAAEEKGAFNEGKNVANLKAVSANSAELSASSVNARELHLINARKSTGLKIIKTRPSTLLAPTTESFNILEQLKLDEIRDADEEVHTDPGQLKAPKKGKKRKKKKQKPIGEDATIFWTQLTTKKPHYYYHQLATTTKVPKKINYIVHKKNALKKKKKEYLNHLKQVLYPFIKFVAFFTVLNPLTLKVFLFALISPVVFGFLGFMALSFLVKPALHLLFDVKKRVDIIKRKKWREKKRHDRWRYGRRPITIHKHYYKDVVAPHPPKSKPNHIWQPPPPSPPPSWPEWVRSDQIYYRPKLQPHKSQVVYEHDHRDGLRPTNHNFNPILPAVAGKLEDWPYGPTQIERFKVQNPPKAVGERLPSTPHQLQRPLAPLLNRDNIVPPRSGNKYKASPLSASIEVKDAPFL